MLEPLYGNKEFFHHPRCKRINITHLNFADDILIFTKGDLGSVKCIMDTFDKFAKAFGLEENLDKSCVYFGALSSQDKVNILNCIGMVEGALPFRYLSISLHSKKFSSIDCKSLVDKIIARHHCWVSNLLSYTGRLELIKSVLGGRKNFWAQLS